jgi:3-vinyl bacteriochlorophyllide hydratase
MVGTRSTTPRGAAVNAASGRTADFDPWGWADSFIAGPWLAHAGLHTVKIARAPLYTAQERARRDATPWTLVQGVLAPVQFLAFLISLVLVVRCLATGEGAAVATVSVVVKTLLLYAIMVTGSVWEKVVFGKWLFAPAFFWEDVFSILVLALHTAYLAMVLLRIGTPADQLTLALAAYAAYAVNAVQFLWKLRQARLEAPPRAPTGAVAA